MSFGGTEPQEINTGLEIKEDLNTIFINSILVFNQDGVQKIIPLEFEDWKEMGYATKEEKDYNDWIEEGFDNQTTFNNKWKKEKEDYDSLIEEEMDKLDRRTKYDGIYGFGNY